MDWKLVALFPHGWLRLLAVMVTLIETIATGSGGFFCIRRLGRGKKIVRRRADAPFPLAARGREGGRAW
jgi:hypothetical protein